MGKESTGKRIVIVGATSGIGLQMARRFVSLGWRVGVAGRRTQALLRFVAECGTAQAQAATIDVTSPQAEERLLQLVERLGGMDVYLHVSGIGHQNRALEPGIELDTLQTNATGFARLTGCAFRYFRSRGGGHIAAVTSIAGTRGLGSAPAYSATKRFQSHYLQSLAQLAHIERIALRVTDIRPGFVATDLLKGDHSYPMLMQTAAVAQSAVRAIVAGRRVATIDWRYRLLVAVWRLIPRRVWERMRVVTKR